MGPLPLAINTAFSPPRMLFLGSFPPRECGIATFTRDVVESFDRAFATKSEIEPGGEDRLYPPEVVGRLTMEDLESYRDVAAVVNAHPAAMLNVQHEYGLFGGKDGEFFLELLRLVTKPVAVSLHTILPDPTDEHRRLARAICRMASAVVVLSETGRDILTTVYDVDPEKVRVIHHGVPDVPFSATAGPKASFGFGSRTVISTFGLISRGKEFRDAPSIARTITALLDDPDLRRSTERRAYRYGRQMTWPHVAREYGALFASLVAGEPQSPLAHTA